MRDLLHPLLPPHIAIGKGKIVDHVGHQSAEIDVVIYDRSVLPPLLYDEAGLGVFPVEACLYAIQVKSTSSSKDLRDVRDKGKSLAGLVYLREACGGLGNPLRRVIPAYFAFKSDLRSPADAREIPEIKRWRKQHAPADFQYEDVFIEGWKAVPSPPIRALCVVGQGYGFYTGQHYATFAATNDHAEVVAFITGVANTLLRPSPRDRGLPFGALLLFPWVM